MSTWFIEDKRTWPQRCFGDMLRNGPLPKHVAIIMDGNRRFAKNRNIKKIEGHISGFEKLVEALNWCFTMDIREVTVYAFSIENFKRSPDEVNALFDLAREKFQRLLNEKEKIDELGVCIRMFGDLSLLPSDLQQIIAKVVQMTKCHENLFMNVCIAYTSKEEMATAVRDICSGVANDDLDICDISEDLIEKCLYTGQSFDVDLLVRTSGEVRLSDFMLWQSNFSVLSFVKQMWPEFSIWNFYFGILNFQLNFDYIQKMKHSVEIKRRTDLEIACKMLVVENRLSIHTDSAQEAVELMKKKQHERTRLFLQNLHANQMSQIDELAKDS